MPFLVRKPRRKYLICYGVPYGIGNTTFCIVWYDRVPADLIRKIGTVHVANGPGSRAAGQAGRQAGRQAVRSPSSGFLSVGMGRLVGNDSVARRRDDTHECRLSGRAA